MNYKDILEKNLNENIANRSKGFLGTKLIPFKQFGPVVIGLDKKEKNNLLTCKLDWDVYPSYPFSR